MSSFCPIPLPYRLFFLYLEPISSLVGAYYAHFNQAQYLSLTAEPYTSTPGQISSTTDTIDAGAILALSTPTLSIILSQLSNLYLLFTLNEALVLRSTTDLKVWRTLLFCLLVADLGHLWSCRLADGQQEWGLYWRFWEWNAMYWGNLGFVYLGASMRVGFLYGVGIGGSGERKGSRKRL